MTSGRAFSPPQRDQFDLFDATVALRVESAQDDLPKTARDLVEIIGLAATIDLVKMFGGDELKVPEIVDGHSRMWSILVETIGPEAAKRLVQFNGGTSIYVPTCAAALRIHRDRDAIRRITAGEEFDKIRRELKTTKRHLYRILKKPL